MAKGSCHRLRTRSDNSLEVPASEPGGPHLWRGQATCILKALSSTAISRGPAQSAAESVLSHAVLSAAKCPGPATSRPWR